MPFTFAHPAAAIPLHRWLGRAGVLSALVIGSMTPDFAYFLPIGLTRRFTHSLAGVLGFCLPMGFLTYYVFNALVRPVVYLLLPAGWRDRLPPLPSLKTGFPAPAWAVLVSIVAGACSHLVWDAWTHGNGFFVVRLPILQTPLWTIDGYTVYVYKVLQHGSSVAGFACLGLWMKKSWQACAPQAVVKISPTAERLRLPVLLGLMTLCAAAGIASGLAHWRHADGVHALQLFLGFGAVRATSVGAAALIALGILLRFGGRQVLLAAHDSTQKPPHRS